MGISIKWDCTYKCNLNCKHCINGKFLGDIKDELTTYEFEQIIKNIENIYKIDYIHILGGEPTTRKDFLDICDILEKYNIKFGFNTNSLLMNNNLVSKLLNNKCIDNIVFSIEGDNAELNDKIRGKKVFDKIVKAIKLTNEYKKILNSKVNLVANIVLSKLNYCYIGNFIDFCIDIGINRIDILELIEDGNAKDIKLSLSMEEVVEVMKIISKKYERVKDKIEILPKFVRPLSKDFMKTVYDLDFPKINHGCGAGMSFCFLNNRGNLFPCDRYCHINEFDNRKNSIKHDFLSVWNSEDFSVPFKIMENNTYKNVYPCNSCNYFMHECFPCPLYVTDNYEITQCSYFIENINRKRYENISPIKESIRVYRNYDNNILISTKSFNTINLNECCIDILDNIMNFKIKDYVTIKEYCKNKDINMTDMLSFLKYLKNEGFINYE